MKGTLHPGNVAMIIAISYLFIWLTNAGLRHVGMQEFQA